MHSALLARTVHRVATASSSSHIPRSFSSKSGSKRPKKDAAQGKAATTPGSLQPDKAQPTSSPPPPSTSAQPNLSEPDASQTSLPTPPTTLSLDFAPPEPGAERERTGAKSSKDSLSSIERRRRQLGRVSFGLFAIGLVGGVIYLGREWSEDELVEKKSVRTLTRHTLLCSAKVHLYLERRSDRRFAVGPYIRPPFVNVRRMLPSLVMTSYLPLIVPYSTSQNRSGRNSFRPCFRPHTKSPILCCYLSTIYW